MLHGHRLIQQLEYLHLCQLKFFKVNSVSLVKHLLQSKHVSQSESVKAVILAYKYGQIFYRPRTITNGGISLKCADLLILSKI